MKGAGCGNGPGVIAGESDFPSAIFTVLNSL